MRILIVIGGSLALLCTARAVMAADPAVVEFNGVRVEVEERAHDGIYPLAPDGNAASLKLDANSTLALRFVLPEQADAAQPTAEWKALARAIAALKTLTDQFELLSRQAADLEAVDVADWQQRNRKFGQSLAEFLDLFEEPDLQKIVSQEELTKTRRQARLQDKSMYAALGELLERKRLDLIRQANRLGTDLSGDTVSIVAYVVPRSGQAQQIHVPEYDNIEARPVNPIPRDSPIPSEAEAQRLREEYAGAKIVSKAVDELIGNRKRIGEQIETLARKLESRAKVFVGDVRQMADALDEARAAELLDALKNTPGEDARRFRDAMSAIKTDVDSVEAAADEVQALVRDLKRADALELMLAMQRTNVLAMKIRGQLGNIPERIEKWPQHLETIAGSAGRLALEPALQLRADLLASLQATADTMTLDLKDSGNAMLDSLPALKTAIDYVSDPQFAAQGSHAIGASAAFDASVQVVAVNLEQARDTAIDLRQSGIAIGDSIEVKLSFKSGQPAAARDRTVTYGGEAVLTGWHRRYSGDVIFVRAIDGPGSDSFKPNAAVSLEWHHFSRNSKNRFWNWLDPGIGFHAANLDQNQDQTVELGAGINVSVWNGLIRLGYGYNLSVKQDRPYAWIGFGLFGMLNRLNELPASKP